MASLSQAQVTQYHESGYIIPDYRLAPSTLEAIRGDHERLVRRYPEFRDYCPTLLRYDLGFLNYTRNSEILDLVAQVLGENFALWNSSFFAKPARNGKKTPWHQDGEYWPIRPIATCTVWMAIDEATADNGCLRVIPGSHRAQRLRVHNTNDDPELTLNQELVAQEYNEAEAVNILLEPGQISLHDVFLVHGSEANHSARPRRGMTLRFMPTNSLYDRELARSLAREKGLVDQSDRTLFLMRGRDLCGKNDYQMRA